MKITYRPDEFQFNEKAPRKCELRFTAWGDVGVIATLTLCILVPDLKGGQPIPKYYRLNNSCNGIAGPGHTEIIANFPAESEIVSLSVYSNAARGLCYAGVYLNFGPFNSIGGTSSQDTLILLNDYVSNIALTWPAVTRPPNDLTLHHATLGNPGAATNLSFNHASGEQWEDWTFKFRLVTSATAGNRVVQLELVDPFDGMLIRAVAPAAQAASLTYDYCFGNFGFASSATVASPPVLLQGTSQMVPFPPCVFGPNITTALPTTTFVRSLNSNILNMQAGDQISAITMCGKRRLTTLS